MAVAARHVRLIMQRPVVTQVVGNDRSVLSAGKCENIGGVTTPAADQSPGRGSHLRAAQASFAAAL